MAESGLTLGYLDFRDEVALFLYGGDGFYDKLEPREQQRVDSVIGRGLRQFYTPPPSQETGKVHEWSFLNPDHDLTLNAAYGTGTVTVALGIVTLAGGTFPSWAASGVINLAGVDYAIASRDSNTQLTLTDLTVNFAAGSVYQLHQDDYALPDDFSAFIGEVSLRPQDNAWVQVQLVGESRIRQYRQVRAYYSVAMQQPWLCAVRPLVNDPTVGTRNQLMFWPRILNTAVVTFAYRVRPDVLSVTNIYPYGASDHSNTIMASIMAAAEQVQEQARGIYWNEFQLALVSSVDLDSRTNRAQQLGYNGDRSDERQTGMHRHWKTHTLDYIGMHVP